MRNALPPRALLGTSAAILELQADTRLAEQTDTQVLISGEPGVGKYALALLIHSRSSRRSGAFETVDCATAAAPQVARTLFGQNGASPQARRSEGGLPRATRRGTLFINSIDAISPEMQARLARVLETDDFLKEGAPEDDWDVFDVRIVAGAPPGLYERVKAGHFQEDLFYRLNVIHLVVPPLRERLADLPAHLHDCLAAYAANAGVEPPEVSSDALAELLAYPWPRNDEELEHLARLLVKRGSRTVTPGDLPPEIRKR